LLFIWFSNKFEKTFLRKIGAQSITVSIKVADQMYCFLCGKMNSTPESLKKYSVPICEDCQGTDLQKFYRLGIAPRYAFDYLIDPPVKIPQKEICEYSGKEYLTDELFEDYGFTKKVAPEMLKEINVNLELCNNFIQPVWRKRRK